MTMAVRVSLAFLTALAIVDSVPRMRPGTALLASIFRSFTEPNIQFRSPQQQTLATPMNNDEDAQFHVLGSRRREYPSPGCLHNQPGGENARHHEDRFDCCFDHVSLTTRQIP